MYTTESFRYRDEVVATNGENYTYHAGAYLGDGLDGGAITSAIRVAQLIGMSLESISSILFQRGCAYGRLRQRQRQFHKSTA